MYGNRIIYLCLYSYSFILHIGATPVDLSTPISARDAVANISILDSLGHQLQARGGAQSIHRSGAVPLSDEAGYQRAAEDAHYSYRSLEFRIAGKEVSKADWDTQGQKVDSGLDPRHFVTTSPTEREQIGSTDQERFHLTLSRQALLEGSEPSSHKGNVPLLLSTSPIKPYLSRDGNYHSSYNPWDPAAGFRHKYSQRHTNRVSIDIICTGPQEEYCKERCRCTSTTLGGSVFPDLVMRCDRHPFREHARAAISGKTKAGFERESQIKCKGVCACKDTTNKSVRFFVSQRSAVGWEDSTGRKLAQERLGDSADASAMSSSYPVSQKSLKARGNLMSSATASDVAHRTLACRGGKKPFCEANCHCTTKNMVKSDPVSTEQMIRYRMQTDYTLPRYTKRIHGECVPRCQCSTYDRPGNHPPTAAEELAAIKKEELEVIPPSALQKALQRVPSTVKRLRTSLSAESSSGDGSGKDSIQPRGLSSSKNSKLSPSLSPGQSFGLLCPQDEPICVQNCYCTDSAILLCYGIPRIKQRKGTTAANSAARMRQDFCRPRCFCREHNLAKKNWKDGPRSISIASGSQPGSVGSHSNSNVTPLDTVVEERFKSDNSQPFGTAPWKRHTIENATSSSSISVSLSTISLSPNAPSQNLSSSLVRRGQHSSRPAYDPISSVSPRGRSRNGYSGSSLRAAPHRTICVGPVQKICQESCRCSRESELICDIQQPPRDQKGNVLKFFRNPSTPKVDPLSHDPSELLEACTPYCGCRDPAGAIKIQGLSVQDAMKIFGNAADRTSPYVNEVSASVLKWMDDAALERAPGSRPRGPRRPLRPPPIDEWLEDAKHQQAPGTDYAEIGSNFAGPSLPPIEPSLSQNLLLDYNDHSGYGSLSDSLSDGGQRKRLRLQPHHSLVRSVEDPDHPFPPSTPETIPPPFSPPSPEKPPWRLRPRRSDLTEPHLSMSSNGGHGNTPGASAITCSNRAGSKEFCESQCYCTAEDTVSCGSSSHSEADSSLQNTEFSTKTCPASCRCGPDEAADRPMKREGWGTWKLPGGGKTLKEDDVRRQDPQSEQPDFISWPPFARLNIAPAFQNNARPYSSPPPALLPATSALFRALSGPKLLSRDNKNSEAHPKLFLHEVTDLVPLLQPRGNLPFRPQSPYGRPGSPPRYESLFQVRCEGPLTQFCLGRCDCLPIDGDLRCTERSRSSGCSGGFMCPSLTVADQVDQCVDVCRCVERGSGKRRSHGRGSSGEQSPTRVTGEGQGGDLESAGRSGSGEPESELSKLMREHGVGT